MESSDRAHTDRWSIWLKSAECELAVEVDMCTHTDSESDTTTHLRTFEHF